MTPGALSGLKVIECGALISGPYCTKLLADLGAEVVKVEPPDSGDESRQHGPFPEHVPHPERSGLFLYLNTNKRGITLNLDSLTGRGLLKRLLDQADVLVISDAKAMSHNDISCGALLLHNPRLIVAAITPFGQTGPYKDYRGYPLTCSAASGLSFGLGYPDREPLALPLSGESYVAGIGAALGVMCAVLARETTGRGQLVDVSETEVATLAFTAQQITTHMLRRVGVHRAGPRMLSVFQCKDGHICLDTVQLAAWISLLELMGTPEWTKTPRYRDRRAMSQQYPEEVQALLAPWFAARTKREVFILTQERRVPCAPVMAIDEVVNDRHLNHRGFFVKVDQWEAGTLTQPGTPYEFSQTPWNVYRPAPLLGEHNEEVYCKELGYSREELAQFRRAGVI